MYVRTLIGRNAGQIQDQRSDVATSNISMGTAEIVSDEEMTAAGIVPPVNNLRETVERFPDGYTTKMDPISGYLLFDPNGNPVNTQPYPNLAQARSAAYNHEGSVEIKSNEVPKYASMKVTELRAFAAENKINLTTAKNKDEIVALIERAMAPAA